MCARGLNGKAELGVGQVARRGWAKSPGAGRSPAVRDVTAVDAAAGTGCPLGWESPPARAMPSAGLKYVQP